MLSHNSARCKTVAGLGYEQLWYVTVGHQTWPSAGHNASFISGKNASSVRTSYSPPSIEMLLGPHGQVSIDNNVPPVLLNASGGESVRIFGSNFGPVGISNVLFITYSNNDLDATSGSTFEPICSVTQAHRQITCISEAGVGFNHTWVVQVGNQSSTSSLLLNPSNASMTSYRPPEIYSLDDASISTGFPPSGTGVVTITGKNFGPIGDFTMKGFYKSILGDDGVSLDYATYVVSCVVIVHDSMVECNTQPGVGSHHQWTLSVGEQLSDASVDLTRYMTPVVTGITLVNATSMETVGGDVMLFTGSNLPPMPSSAYQNKSALISASYWTKSSNYGVLGNGVVVGYSLETTVYSLVDCEVVEDYSKVRCYTAPGVGKNLGFQITVGGQNSSLSFDVLNYTTPTVSSVDVDGWSGSSEAFFDTDGGVWVNVSGYNFGPLMDANTINVHLTTLNFSMSEGNKYYNVDGFGSPMAKSVLLTECSVVVAHTIATCKIPPGVGFDHHWGISVGSQFSGYLEGFTSSYNIPSVLSVVHMYNSTGGSVLDASSGWMSTAQEGFATTGGDVIYITGTNFGPIGGGNKVFAASYSGTCSDCLQVTLYDSKVQPGDRSFYNFAATSCEVS